MDYKLTRQVRQNVGYNHREDQGPQVIGEQNKCRKCIATHQDQNRGIILLYQVRGGFSSTDHVQ